MFKYKLENIGIKILFTIILVPFILIAIILFPLMYLLALLGDFLKN